MLIKELLNLKEEKDNPVFNDDQIQDIEQYLGDVLDDAVEVFSVGKSSPGRHEKGEYVATIDYDGKDEKGYRGYAYFDCHEDGGKGGRIVDFKLVNLTGVGYRKVPQLDADE